MTRLTTNTVSKSLFCLALWADIFVTACGGGDISARKAPGSCGAMTACGGAVVGHWTITDSCVGGTLDLGAICPGITADLSVTFSGGVTYNADLTYVGTGSGGGTVHYVFPASCLGGKTCADVQASILSPAANMGMGMSFQSATCKTSGGGCSCDATLASSSLDESGTYTLAGGMLTIAHGVTIEASPYCVQGTSMTQMVPPAGGASGNVVLTKQ